jgi:hypothetical protein
MIPLIHNQEGLNKNSSVTTRTEPLDDSELVAHEFEERDPGVEKMISMAIQGARKNGRHGGICGQAPSDYPDFSEFLAAVFFLGPLQSLGEGPSTWPILRS